MLEYLLFNMGTNQHNLVQGAEFLRGRGMSKAIVSVLMTKLCGQCARDVIQCWKGGGIDVKGKGDDIMAGKDPTCDSFVSIGDLANTAPSSWDTNKPDFL